MSLVLKVDGDRWRDHLRAVVAEAPHLIPVAKGNGYGLGVGRLARRASWLGSSTMAVGTYDELAEATSRFAGDIVVLTPWRGFLPAAVNALGNPRIIHTVGRMEDLGHLKGQRIVIEVATSMQRHGFAVTRIREALAASAGARIEALSVHLPLPGAANGVEFRQLLDALAPAMAEHGIHQVWASHLSSEQLGEITHPDIVVRPRIGTRLWLGAPETLHVEARVLDAHSVGKGATYGYRRRVTKAAGTLLIVSGGTAHGIGLEAPAGSLTTRDRAARLARGGMEAMGRTRSPFFIGTHQAMFAEPPHMQSSMLFLPASLKAPEPGEVIAARVRHTATTFDAVEIV